VLLFPPTKPDPVGGVVPPLSAHHWLALGGSQVLPVAAEITATLPRGQFGVHGARQRGEQIPPSGLLGAGSKPNRPDYAGWASAAGYARWWLQSRLIVQDLVDGRDDDLG
jgi:hypothetical protein